MEGMGKGGVGSREYISGKCRHMLRPVKGYSKL